MSETLTCVQQNEFLRLREAPVISIIIPTLNEERSLPHLFDAISRQRAAHEVIVVDGGSRDRTLEVARERGARTLVSPPGRGTGIDIGAEASHGEVLFFLHADSTLPPVALARIDEALSTDSKIIGGNFRLVFDGDTGFSRWLTVFCALIRMLGFYYGDSGIFVRRSVYQALGGFRPIPVMEDWDFVRRLERFGRTCCIKDPPLVTSSRRFEGRHPLAIICGLVRIHALFFLGASPERLAEIYKTHAPARQIRDPAA
jgi:rSAM/selenodomain-associated transferase 2